MNFWECAEPGCKRTATGVGAAYGLRAIGWHFTPGGPILCPEHRPDMVPCTQGDDESMGKPCRSCAGSAEADRLQAAITTDEDRALLERLQSGPLVIRLGPFG